MQSYFAKIAVPDGTAKYMAAFNKLSDKAQREKIMQRLNEAEGLRRPFGRSKSRGREENGMTQAELYEVQ